MRKTQWRFVLWKKIYTTPFDNIQIFVIIYWTKSTFPGVRAKCKKCNLIFLSTTLSLVDFFFFSSNEESSNKQQHKPNKGYCSTRMPLQLLLYWIFSLWGLLSMHYSSCFHFFTSIFSTTGGHCWPWIEILLVPVTSPLNCTASISFAIY